MPNLNYRSSRERDVQDYIPMELAHRITLAPFIDEFKKVLELAVLKATAQLVDPVSFPMPMSNEVTLESLLLQRLQTLKPTQQQIAVLNFQPRMERLALLSAMDFQALNEHNVVEGLSSSISVYEMAAPLLSTRTDMVINRLAQTEAAFPVPQIRSATISTPLQAILRIHKIRCWDETDPETGDDEIQLAAVAVHVNGHTSRLGPYPIRDDFDDNEEQVYNPAWHLGTFNIAAANDVSGFPKLCSCLFILSEIDNGGFPSFLQDIYEIVREKVAKAVAKAGASLVGGPLGALAGIAISSAVDHLMGELLDLIRRIWEDDLFPPHPVKLYFPRRYTSFNGSRYSPMYTAWINGHGGQYTIDYSWHLVGDIVMPPPIPPDPIPEPEVTLGATVFKDTYWSGEQRFLKLGKHRLAAHGRGLRVRIQDSPFNDEIDSVKVEKGCKAQLFKTADFTGEFIEVFHDQPIPYFNDQWRDQISSIIVERLAPN